MSDAPTTSGHVGAGLVRAAARAFERDRYLAALLSPAAVREDLVALAAFAGDLARIPAFVSEPMLGEIRLQWWRDTVDAALSEPAVAAGHPIADTLARAIRRHSLPPRLVHDLIDAQVNRLDDHPFDDLDALTANLSSWDGGLFQLAWRILGGAGDAPAWLAAAGEVYGLSRCLLEAPAELAQGRIVLPRSSLAACGLSPEVAAEPASAAQWRMLSVTLAAETRRRLDVLVSSYQEADAKARLAALPVALVRPYLTVSEQAEAGPFLTRDVSPLSRVWRLWRSSRTGRLSV